MEVDRSTMVRDNRQISIRLELVANKWIAQEGLTAAQGQVLLYILQHSDVWSSLTSIHQEFGCSMAALSGLLKRLREKGYVRVEPCAADDRRKLLFGTEKGERVQEFLDRAMGDLLDQLYHGFSQEELELLDCLQKKMLRNLSASMETKIG